MKLLPPSSSINLTNKDRHANKKYKEKTGKGYTQINMALGNPDQGVKPTIKKVQEEEKKEDNLPKSKLDEGLTDLIKLIFNMELIEQSIV